MRHAKPKHGDISDPVAGRRPGTAGATHLAPPRCGAAGAPPLPATRDTLQTAAAVTGNARTTGALPAAKAGRQAGRRWQGPGAARDSCKPAWPGQTGEKKHEASFATQPMGSCHAAKTCRNNYPCQRVQGHHWCTRVHQPACWAPAVAAARRAPTHLGTDGRGQLCQHSLIVVYPPSRVLGGHKIQYTVPQGTRHVALPQHVLQAGGRGGREARANACVRMCVRMRALLRVLTILFCGSS